MKNKRIIFPAHQPEPVFHDPYSDEAIKAKDTWLLGEVEDDIDDSLKYIEHELLAIGVGGEQADCVLERIKKNVIQHWAARLIYQREHDGFPPAGREEFLEAKFGPDGPNWSPDGSDV